MNGGMPLEVLDGAVDDWIRRTGESTG